MIYCKILFRRTRREANTLCSDFCHDISVYMNIFVNQSKC